MPDDVAKRSLRYPVIPVTRIDRLAIDKDFQGQRIGAAMLWNTANHTLRTEGHSPLPLTRKTNPPRHFGFVASASKPLQLLLPFETIAKA